MSLVRRMAALSVVASIVTLGLKMVAYLLTGSVSLLSDAVESVVNLAAGLMAFTALTIAARPADSNHPYGHDKVEYFASGLEGSLILFAALTIIYTAVQRLLNPGELTDLGLGLAVSMLASAVNLVVSQLMLRVARRKDSITLEADAQHLMTDVWTSVGVAVGLSIVIFAPGLQILDPIIAILVALNIIVTGVTLIRRSVSGLMDNALPAAEVKLVDDAIRGAAGGKIQYHDLRTRKSGSRRFVEFHLSVPGTITVQGAHDVADAIERECQAKLANTLVTVHCEPEMALSVPNAASSAQ